VTEITQHQYFSYHLIISDKNEDGRRKSPVLKTQNEEILKDHESELLNCTTSELNQNKSNEAEEKKLSPET